MTTLKLPVGIDDFAKVRREGFEYVDKSLFIKELLDDPSETILITRPRRFGKTINLSLLNYYFNVCDADQNAKLFAGLKIMDAGSEYTQHQGKYPTIFISLKGLKANSYELFRDNLIEQLHVLFKKHDYLLQSAAINASSKELLTNFIEKKIGDGEINQSLLYLSSLLEAHHGEKVYIIIDEYDAAVHEAFIHGFHQQVIDLLRSMLGNALKSNLHLKRGVITGILRIAKTNMFSDLNNISIYSMLNDQYSEHFGFTTDEVSNLLARAPGNGDQLKLATAWYNGYKIGPSTLYNPWSILNFIKNNFSPRAYWVATGGDSLIRQLLLTSNLETKQLFEQLLQGNEIDKVINEFTIFQHFNNNPEIIWGLLLFGGYLTVNSYEYIGTKATCKLAIPNKEVAAAYDDMITMYFTTAGLTSYQRFITSLIAGDIEYFQQALQSYLHESTSYFDLNTHTPEQVYHLFVLGLCVGMRDDYIIQSNHESGFGRYDVMLIPKDKQKPGIVLEFKTASSEEQLANTAEEAIKQINHQNYAQQLISHGVNKVNKLGIAFAGKSVHVKTQET